jgi:hypothetical protein
MNELEEQIKQLNINNEIKNNPIYLLQDIGNNQYKIQNKVNNWKKCVFEKINKSTQRRTKFARLWRLGLNK